MADNLDFGIEMIAETEVPSGQRAYSASGNNVTVAHPGHPFYVGGSVSILTSDDSGMVGNSYTVTAITANSFTFVKVSPSPASGYLRYRRYLRVSDRNKYVGGDFYKALCQFPIIKRTLGEWLSPDIEFSTLEIPISNVAGALNEYLQAGAVFDNWIGKQVSVRLGIRDAAATYIPIYSGKVTDIGGMARERSLIRVRTRDRLDTLNQNFPKAALTQTTWADLETNLAGVLLPVVYGDWTVGPLQRGKDTDGLDLGETASCPAFVVNGASATVLSGVDNVRCLVSANDNTYFDTANVWVRRGDIWGLVPSGNITALAANRDFEVVQAFTFNGAAYVYQSGDTFWCRVKGKSLAGYENNPVSQAMDLLKTFADAVSGDFDSTWDYYRDKATPAESAISLIPSRICQQDQESVLAYAQSLLEQVRLKMFQNKDLMLSLSAMHFDEFDATPSYTVRQWDVKADSLQPRLDDRNIWNRARASYAFDPATKSESRQTPIYRVQAAVDQIGREISKKIIFPNLYTEADVINQTKEMLRLATGYPEFIAVTLTQRATLVDVGDFVLLNIAMGSTVFENVPAMVRELGHDPNGYGVPVVLWSFQMTPFLGWNPGYSGIVGGVSAVITQE
jgi:hypothetical protein